MLEKLFPAGVVTEKAGAGDWRAPLHPEEEAALGPVAPARRSDFGAGRACARRALARLGLPAGPLLRRADRSPRWPPGVVGSISHCPGLCAAAVARADRFSSLGLDVECTERTRPEIARRICTPRERELLPRLGAEGLALVFSAKEAVYKAWHPLTGSALGFHDVELEFELDSGRFLGRLRPGSGPDREVAGRFARTEDHVAAGLVLPRG